MNQADDEISFMLRTYIDLYVGLIHETDYYHYISQEGQFHPFRVGSRRHLLKSCVHGPINKNNKNIRK